jgi:hypothetical protein
MEYRRCALCQTFRDVTAGEDTFGGIGETPGDDLVEAFGALEPDLKPVMTFLRKSPEGQSEPNFIHSDASMGKVTGIYYMNPDPAPGDGTAFWMLNRTGARGGEWSDEVRAAAKTHEGWTRWHTAEARFNRLVVFPADWFHSRGLFYNYGTGETARLIQVVFAR